MIDINKLFPDHQWDLDVRGFRVCKKCKQSMKFVLRIDERDCLPGEDYAFKKYNISFPVLNKWVICGWAISNANPLVPINCQELIDIKNMHKALK